jgi:hypothetical protein
MPTSPPLTIKRKKPGKEKNTPYEGTQEGEQTTEKRILVNNLLRKEEEEIPEAEGITNERDLSSPSEGSLGEQPTNK